MSHTAKVLLVIIGLAIFGKNLFDNVYNKIVYGTTKLRTRGLDVTATGVGLKVQVVQPITNENSISFPLDAFAAIMYYGRRPLARFAMPQATVIAANSTVELVFDGVLDFAETAETLSNMISTGNWLQSLRFEGTATSAGITFPFNHTVSVG